MTINSATIDLYSAMSTEELRAEFDHYTAEAKAANNETRRELAENDAAMYAALIAARA